MTYLMMNPTQKARLTLDYLNSNGGALPEEVVNQFLTVMIPQSDFLDSVTSTPMVSQTFRIPTLEFGEQALHRRTRGQALADDQRTRPTSNGPVITAFDFSAEIDIEDEVIESGVQGSTLINKVMNDMGKRVSLDSTTIAVQSDLTSLDDDFNAFDGYHVGVTTNTASAGSTRLDGDLLSTLFKLMPDAIADSDTLAVRTGMKPVHDFKKAEGERATALGDDYRMNKRRAQWQGFLITGDSQIPQTLAPGTDSVAIMADQKNFWTGFHRKIKTATERNERAQLTTVIFSMRYGVQWAVEKHAAKLEDVLAS